MDMRDGHPAANVRGRPRASEVTKPHRWDSPAMKCASQMPDEDAIEIRELPDRKYDPGKIA